MNPGVDTSCEKDILNSDEKVFGLIYEIVNHSTNQSYIGQTVSHRKNKAKWRPFGTEGRFRDHISEAINNTKRKQCSYLNNAIRKYGSNCFTVRLITVCHKEKMNELEQIYIAEKHTLFPNGYNLTKGGKSAYVESHLDHTTLCQPKKRGGCTHRSEKTRAKMSKRSKELSDQSMCAERAANATKQHYAKKLLRFKDTKIDLGQIDSYIRKKGTAVVVSIGEATASFRSKHDSHEQKLEKARAFIKEVHDATLSNCGKPVKPE